MSIICHDFSTTILVLRIIRISSKSESNENKKMKKYFSKKGEEKSDMAWHHHTIIFIQKRLYKTHKQIYTLLFTRFITNHHHFESAHKHGISRNFFLSPYYTTFSYMYVYNLFKLLRK